MEKNEKCSGQRAQVGQNHGSRQVQVRSGGKGMGPQLIVGTGEAVGYLVEVVVVVC